MSILKFETMCFLLSAREVQGFARSLHTSAKAPRACSRLLGNFCNGVVSVGASYSVLVFCQFGAVLKHCRQHQQTLLHCKSCQAISSMRVALLHVLVCKDRAKPQCFRTAPN